MRDAVTKQRLAIEDARQTAAALAEGQAEGGASRSGPPFPMQVMDRQRMDARTMWWYTDVRHLHSRLQLQASFSAEPYNLR